MKMYLEMQFIAYNKIKVEFLMSTLSLSKGDTNVYQLL